MKLNIDWPPVEERKINYEFDSLEHDYIEIKAEKGGWKELVENKKSKDGEEIA